MSTIHIENHISTKALISFLYKTEEKTGQLFSIFAFLAIFIACIGLTGLVAYTSNTRTKEIGIRKVHGAGILDIVKMF